MLLCCWEPAEVSLPAPKRLSAAGTAAVTGFAVTAFAVFPSFQSNLTRPGAAAPKELTGTSRPLADSRRNAESGKCILKSM